MIVKLSSMYYFFFFKQKTAYEMRISDWSSDVCSSDLLKSVRAQLHEALNASAILKGKIQKNESVAKELERVRAQFRTALDAGSILKEQRSEERRVGQECVSPCRSRW